MSAPNDLAIQTNQPVNNNNDDDDASQEMPLSPASVKNYEKNKSRHSKKSKDNQLFSEEDDSDDSDEASYESDKKSDSDSDSDDEEGAFDASHLNARLEAMDGTTKLKTLAEKKKEEEEEEEDDEDDSSNDDDNDSATNVQQLSESVAGLRLGTGDGSLTSISEGAGTGAGGTVASGAPGTNRMSIPSIAMEGEFYQDPTSTGSTISQGQEERLQEPVKPHIALPCLVETAKNPARTRITLKYSGSDVPHPHNHPEDMENKASTRGRKNYMVATDLSGESWHATEWAITTLLRNGDEMNVVTIVEDDTKDSKAVKKGVQTEMREDAEKLTKNIHEQLEHTCLKDITVIIHIIAATKSMGAKELLVEMIDDLEDLSTVVVGSRGRGAIKGLLLGSISNFLVHNSSVPVMVVRAPKKPKGKKKTRRGRPQDQTRAVRVANLKYEQAFADVS
ncbi:hypothetical protein EC957_011060 [Mortierella hygrophila]|uniref:UspA domain-containing protein n=1 Tax=Mortierella hygrophila TaxID=979708 RepID=A0A9P6F8B2_9FUNG|nr:hypothetical protein EC957_011060 [Mortierella hygrophila]